MAKKPTKKLNTSLSDAKSRKPRTKKGGAPEGYDSSAEISFSEEHIIPEEAVSEDITYTMGDIQVGDSEGGEDEEFKKASESLAKADEEENEDDWQEDDYNHKDEDPFLDMDEGYDMDNPYTGED